MSKVAGVISFSLLLLLCSWPACAEVSKSFFVGDPYVVKLERIHMPGLGTKGKNFFVSTLRVGSAGQEMRVVFDLASGQVVLPSTLCTDVTCLKHQRYDPLKSTSGYDVTRNSVRVNQGERKHDVATIGLTIGELGYGEIKGNLMRESVCFAAEDQGQTCVEMGIVSAGDMSDLPYRVLPQDGFVGLGLEGLSISRDFNFFGRLMAQGLQPQFAVFLGAGDLGGEISFGGVNPKHVVSPITWVPVTNPEEGFWQVSIRAVRAGNSMLDICREGTKAGVRECRGVIDAQTSHLSAPENMAESIEEALIASLPKDSVNLDGGCEQGLDLQLILEGGVTLTLPSANYAVNQRVSANGASCEPWLLRHQHPSPLGDGLFVLGESLLRRYYTVYDWETKRVGFSLTAPNENLETNDKPQPEQPLIFLLQVKFTPGKLFRK